MGRPLGFAPEAVLGDSGLPPVRARRGGGAAAWVAGGSGSSRYSGGLAARAAGNIVL